MSDIPQPTRRVWVKANCSNRWYRGITLTLSIPLRKEVTSRDIRLIYQDRYAGEKLIKVVGEPPLVSSIMGRHGVEIGGFDVDRHGKRMVM